ncbi:hypothetical protein [Salinispora cortesiana]|uniref:hypothetical protein n=1 Tax=Salinispora cortesiana TaxID=1305843 RepID=UPI00067EA645|nr:hypothetical protein [Salinispora cortesiana]
MASGAAPRASSGQSWRAWGGFAVVTVIGAVVVTAILTEDRSTVVPPPTTTERNDTVALLRDAAEQQDICYGWELEQGYGDVVSAGSNLGAGISVVDHPQCPRWLRVAVTVVYTPESSEAADYATVAVQGSSEFTDELFDLAAGISRFGLDEAAFLEEPGWAVTRAAVSLPLLVVERGVASPESMITSAPVAAPSPLPAAGSDLWRERSGWLIGAAGMLLIAVLLVVVGLVQWRRRRGAAAGADGRGEGTVAARTVERA